MPCLRVKTLITDITQVLFPQVLGPCVNGSPGVGQVVRPHLPADLTASLFEPTMEACSCALLFRIRTGSES